MAGLGGGVAQLCRALGARCIMASDGYIQLWRDANSSPQIEHALLKPPSRPGTTGTTRVGLQIEEDVRTTRGSAPGRWRESFAREHKANKRSHSAASQRRAVSAGPTSSSQHGGERRMGGATHAGRKGGRASPMQLHGESSPSSRVHSPLPPRAHSVLGFQEKRQVTSLPRPKGFDLRAYVRRQGSANDIRIGINGSSSSDEYFEKYLEECESAARLEMGENPMTLPSGGGSNSEKSDDDDVTMMSSPSPADCKEVPLCWEDQLRKAKV